MGVPRGYLPEISVEDRGYRTPCWILPATHSEGYARITIDGRRVFAHRAVYEAMKGPVPPGLEPDHLCRQRACCRWDHLEAVTRATNARRGARASKLTVEKAREIRALRAAGLPCKEVAARFDIPPARVSIITAGREWVAA
jgi:hypothetical protein